MSSARLRQRGYDAIHLGFGNAGTRGKHDGMLMQMCGERVVLIVLKARIDRKLRKGNPDWTRHDVLCHQFFDDGSGRLRQFDARHPADAGCLRRMLSKPHTIHSLLDGCSVVFVKYSLSTNAVEQQLHLGNTYGGIDVAHAEVQSIIVMKE
ncbi:protein of unknown function [Cupriavidus taiwanensis]|nr:protein of unknown function [Cupriavidus taiwanensis]